MSSCPKGVNYNVSIPYLTGMNGKLIGQVLPFKIFTDKKIAQKGKALYQKGNRGGKRKKRRKSRKRKKSQKSKKQKTRRYK